MFNRTKYAKAAEKALEPNIYKHSLAVESCMDGLYEHLKKEGRTVRELGSKEDWLLAGLIHDIDYAGNYKADHPAKTREALADHDLEISDKVFEIVQDHNAGHSGIKPKSLAGWAIFTADSLTGLIVAVALVYPTRQLADVKLSSIIKRFLKEPKFAAGTRREDVKQCELADGLNIPLERFVEICLFSMQAIASSLGL